MVAIILLFVIDVLIYTKETFIQDFLEILKQVLLDFLEILEETFSSVLYQQ